MIKGLQCFLFCSWCLLTRTFSWPSLPVCLLFHLSVRCRAPTLICDLCLCQRARAGVQTRLAASRTREPVPRTFRWRACQAVKLMSFRSRARSVMSAFSLTLPQTPAQKLRTLLANTKKPFSIFWPAEGERVTGPALPSAASF